MKSTLRIAFAGLTLAFAAHASAAESWISSDSRSMEAMRGSVVLVQLGTTNTCVICKLQPTPVKLQAETVQRTGSGDFQASIKRMREANAAMPQLISN